MALTQCAECGKSISTQATSCPHCGAPGQGVPTLPPAAAEPPKKRDGLSGCAPTVIVAGLIIGGCAVFALLTSNPSKPTRSDSTATSGSPRLVVKVNTAEYGHGYLKLVGTMESVGERGPIARR